MSDGATVIVDNRLRQRWISVAKSAGRRRFNRLAIVIGAALIAVTGLVVVESPLLDVDHIAFSGAGHTTEEALLAAIGISHGDALLTANLAAAERRLEALPWVAEASVSRSLPGTLTIEITERTPDTLITTAAGSALIDDTGRILETGDAAQLAAKLPAQSHPVTIAVPATSATDVDLAPGGDLPPAVADVAHLAARVRDNPVGAVAAVVVDTDLTLTLHQGGSVLLGDASELDAKIEAFRTMFARVDLACLERIDLTVPTHPTLTRAEPCS